ncbi:MAG: CSLREA domain-containing protein [Wenzhouxiangella sp.]|nr:CSLREA domain-containing protein [Wenzhouxiangella sp.]
MNNVPSVSCAKILAQPGSAGGLVRLVRDRLETRRVMASAEPIGKRMVCRLFKSSLGSGLAALVLSGLIAAPALAAKITVDTLEDVVAEDGQCSLREAIMNANGASQAGSIDCPAGDMAGNVIVFDAKLAGQPIVLDGEQLTVPSRNLVIQGPVIGDSGGIVIDGDLRSRVLQVAGPGQHVEVTLRDLTLTRGWINETSQRGAGLLVANVQALAENIVVSGSVTQSPGSNGAGIQVFTAELALVDSQVINNRVEGTGVSGAGVSVLGDALSLIRSQVLGNRTQGPSANGAGIHAASWGATASVVSLVDSTISGNLTEGSNGFGAGLWMDKGSLGISGSTISDNSASAGAGGISVNELDMTMINSTVSGNSAVAAGAGLQLRLSTVSMLHGTVAFNSSGSGSAHDIAVIGSSDVPSILFLTHSLVVQEQAARPTCLIGADASIVQAGSLSTHASCTGEATLPESIGLEALADNGGLTPTHRLTPGSVAVAGAGDCPLDHDIVFDQRGQPRPGGNSGACDVGAFESQFIADVVFGDRFELPWGAAEFQ